MIVRCALAAIDFNENIDRKPKLSADGKPRYKMKVGCSEFIINHKIFILKVDRSGSKVLISTETKLMKNFDETPEPHSYEVADTEKLLNDLRAVEESAKPLYIKLTVEISKIKEASKKSEQLKIAEGAWNQLQSKVSQLTRKGQEYKSKFTPAPAPTVPQPAQSHPRSAPLERLPLPIFSGAKADYLKFKQKFKNHVKYETEQEKLMALQSKCLSKDDDKKTVANEVTLKGCWEKLDYEYGDIDTLVAEIFSNWTDLKPPKNDKEFVQFVKQIDYGVATLETLGHGKDIDSSHMSVMLEKKLSEEQKTRFCRIYATDDAPLKNRMTSLMKFLQDEKKTAHLRLSSYSSTFKKTENTTSVSATGTGSDRGRGGGASRGRGNGGGRGGGANGQNRGRGGGNFRGNNRGGYQGKGGDGKQNKRGEPSTKCLSCDGDHATSKCGNLRDKTNDKAALLGLAVSFPQPFCTWCMEPGHSIKWCKNNSNDLKCPCGNNFRNIFLCCSTDDCKARKNWPKEISSSTSLIASSLTMVNGVKMGETLLPIQMIPATENDKMIRVMFDNCSQSTFLLNKTAAKLGIKGVPISYILVCTDGTRKPMTGLLYKFLLKDMAGNYHEIEAVGLNTISSAYPGIKVTDIRSRVDGFSMRNSVTDSKLERTGGPLDLLVGSDLSNLHPKGVKDIRKLTLMRSNFGTGWTLMGHDKELIQFTGNQPGVRVNVCAVERIQVKKFFDQEVLANTTGTKDIQFLDAVSTESIGISVPAKCASCKAKTDNCNECKLLTEMTTYLEHLQDEQIKENIEYLPKEERFIASYPYTNEINNLLPNKETVLKRAMSFENNLKKAPEDIKLLNESLFDSFDRGVFRFLSQEEIDDWSGQVHFIPMNRVYKESESTPVRLVFDSGQPDRNGRSLNGCMGKGKNPLNHFGSVVMNFRAAEQVACGDIKKMFNQIKVREEDQHLRRFFVRPDGFAGKENFREAVITCINFGEKAAGGVATAVKDRCAQENSGIHPEVAINIQKDCFMDDVNVSAKYEENIDDKINKAEQIMAKGGFKFKNWVKSGQEGEKEIGKSECGIVKSLGMSWKTENDKLVYRIKLNFSKKARNRYNGKNCTRLTLNTELPKLMTKRIALKLNHTVFDPAMLIQPWILKLRLAFREILIYEKENDVCSWDAALPEKFRNDWSLLCEEMFELETLEFDRSLVPRGYDKTANPTLVIFSDGSDKGQCAVAYLVWKMKENEENVIKLVTSRTKIASMTKMTTPRSELTAAQLQTRLKVWLLKILNIKIEKTIHIVDASIILGMITNISLKFDTFSAPRVTEIQTNTKIESWFWVDTKQNPSDVGTRGKVTIKDLEVGSMWREGPDWLRGPFSTWPLRSDFKKHTVPGLKKEFEVLETATNLTSLMKLNDVMDDNDEEQTVSANANNTTENVCNYPNLDEEESIMNEIDFKRYSSWFKLINVSATTLILGLKTMNKYKLGVKIIPTFLQAQKIVKHKWIKSMMNETRKMLLKTKLPGLMIFEEDEIIYATTRVKQESWNPDKLIILSPKHPLTAMILRSLHEVDHRGVMHTVARSRIFYWIPQAAKLLRKIKKNCFSCRIKDAEAMKQLMAPLPAFRLKSSPVWNFSMLDLFGPITVKDFVNQRTQRKTWGVLITCLTTRACQAYLTESFSTDHLLCVLRKHEARNGSPAEYYADLGKQIVGADRILTEAVESLDKNAIERAAASRGVKFNFGTPYFPEGQGAVERLIQEIKKNLKIITSGTMSFAELDTALAEASYLVNCRPMQPNPAMGEDSFICPNDIIMGRSDKAPAEGEFFDNRFTRRVSHIKRLTEEFWKKWSQSYYQTLVKYHKWKLKTRNAEPGDVVLVLDKEGPKGKFALGRISSVKTDEDGVVRTVTIKYKIDKSDQKNLLIPSPYKYAERNVRNLALVVTAQECNEVEEINLDEIRFKPNDEESATDDRNDEGRNNLENANEDQSDDNLEVEQSDENDAIEVNSEENVMEEQEDDEPASAVKETRQELPRTSTGRKRWAPKKLDL